MTDAKLREKADALIAFTQQGPSFIAWVEAVTDAIAPEPENAATTADRIAAVRSQAAQGRKVRELLSQLRYALDNDHSALVWSFEEAIEAAEDEVEGNGEGRG